MPGLFKDEDCGFGGYLLLCWDAGGLWGMNPLSAVLLMLPSLPLKITDCTITESVWRELEGAGPSLVVGGKIKKSGSDLGLIMLIPTSLYGNTSSAPLPRQPDFLLPEAEASSNNRQHACTREWERQTARLFIEKKKTERWRGKIDILFRSVYLAPHMHTAAMLLWRETTTRLWKYDDFLIINITANTTTLLLLVSVSPQREVRGHGQLHNKLVMIHSLVSRTLQWVKSCCRGGLLKLPRWKTVTLIAALQPWIWIISQLEHSPNLFCIAGFDLWSLLDKFGVLLHIFDPPLCMLLQVVKLILQKRRRRND